MNILFVEAKQSCPNAANREESAEKQKQYEAYFSDVTDKFIDSINMFATTVLGWHGENTDVGADILQTSTYAGNPIKLVLVIAGAEESWLSGPKAELESRLLRYRKIWKANVLVLNREMAVRLGLADG